MKRDSDIIRDVLVWLLRDPAPSSSASLTAPDIVFPPTNSGADPSATVNDPSDVIDRDPLNFESIEVDELGALNPDIGFSNRNNPVNRLGDIPAVQDRFQALLKRRLRLEIERRPPLFPWEQANQDYPDWIASDMADPALWLQQLRELKLPTQLPDEVLAMLLSQCQAILQQSLQTGIRLIKAVEPLFPDQPQTLDQMARLVLTSSARGMEETFSVDYATANQPQQVALTMMAARTIFANLTLEVSAAQPQAHRQWLTALGALTLEADYRPQPNTIEIRSTLPEQGYLQISDGPQTHRVERDQPGAVSLVVTDPEPNLPYCLEVGLAAESPLQYLLTLVDAPEA